MFNNQGTSKPEASHSENGDMAWACCEELVELDDVQLATVVGGFRFDPPPAGNELYIGPVLSGSKDPRVDELTEWAKRFLGKKTWYDNFGRR